MAKQLWGGGALLAPVPPVLVTCGSMDKPNVLTVGWTGILNTIPPKTYISIRPERYSYSMIRESGEFVINLPTTALVRAVDFCGVRSGRQVDKFAQTALTAAASSRLSCPMLEQSPLSLECRVFEQIELGSHTMFLADIVAVDVDETLIDPAGKLHLDRAGLLAYAHGEYFALGEKLGSFGFSVRKKPPRRAQNARFSPKPNDTQKNRSPAQKTVKASAALPDPSTVPQSASQPSKKKPYSKNAKKRPKG